MAFAHQVAKSSSYRTIRPLLRRALDGGECGLGRMGETRDNRRGGSGLGRRLAGYRRLGARFLAGKHGGAAQSSASRGGSGLLTGFAWPAASELRRSPAHFARARHVIKCNQTQSLSSGAAQQHLSKRDRSPYNSCAHLSGPRQPPAWAPCGRASRRRSPVPPVLPRRQPRLPLRAFRCSSPAAASAPPNATCATSAQLNVRVSAAEHAQKRAQYMHFVRKHAAHAHVANVSRRELRDCGKGRCGKPHRHSWPSFHPGSRRSCLCAAARDACTWKLANFLHARSAFRSDLIYAMRSRRAAGHHACSRAWCLQLDGRKPLFPSSSSSLIRLSMTWISLSLFWYC
jgi:hypothetical protein